MDIRSLQKPLKEQYRSNPDASRITLRAKGGQTDAPIACSVDIGRAIYQAEAHKGVGGGRGWRVFRRQAPIMRQFKRLYSITPQKSYKRTLSVPLSRKTLLKFHS